MIVYSQFLAGDYLDDISICDDIIEFHKNSPYKKPGEVWGGLDIRMKHSMDATLDRDKNLHERYTTLLKLVVDKYKELYPWCDYYCPWGMVEGINVQHYPVGGGYFIWHTERTGPDVTLPDRYRMGSSRHLVFMTYLNDVTDGGETEWANQEIKIQPKKGLTVVWPADWTFTHRGLPSHTQEKYIATGWLNYIPGSRS